MRISSTEPSPMILIQTKKLKKLKVMPQKCKTSFGQKGWCINPQNYNFSLSYDKSPYTNRKEILKNQSQSK